MSTLLNERRRPSGLPLGQDLTIKGLAGFVRRLSVARSVDEVAHVVAQTARTLLDADGMTVVLRDGDLCYYLEENAISPLWKGRRFPIEACISGWCMINRRNAAIPGILQDDRVPQDAYAPTFVKSLAMVPVPQDEPFGAVGAYWARKREFSHQELELLQTIANATAPALLHAKLSSQAHGTLLAKAGLLRHAWGEPVGAAGLCEASLNQRARFSDAAPQEKLRWAA